MNLQVAQYADEVGNNKVASNEVDQCLRYTFAVNLAYENYKALTILHLLTDMCCKEHWKNLIHCCCMRQEMSLELPLNQ